MGNSTRRDRTWLSALVLGALIAVATAYSIVAGRWWIALATANVFAVFFIYAIGAVIEEHVKSPKLIELLDTVVIILVAVVSTVLLGLSIALLVKSTSGDAFIIVLLSLMVTVPLTPITIADAVREIRERRKGGTAIGEGNGSSRGSNNSSNNSEKPTGDLDMIAKELEELKRKLEEN